MGGLLQQGLDRTYQESGAGYQGGVLGGLLEGCSKRVVDLNGWMIGREKREEMGKIIQSMEEKVKLWAREYWNSYCLLLVFLIEFLL